MNKSLAFAHHIKEDLKLFWKQSSKEDVERISSNWLAQAWSSGIARLIKLANTIAIHKFGILNCYDHPVSSGRKVK